MRIVEITEPPFSGKLYRYLTEELLARLKAFNGRNVSASKVAEIVDTFLKENTEANVEIEVSHVCVKSMSDSDTSISGLFDYDNLEFTFYLISQQDIIKSFKAKEFVYQLIDTFEHEMLHYLQSQKRGDEDPTPGKGHGKEEYLSRPDEIESYAVNIARELHRMYDSVDDALNALRTARTTDTIPLDLADYQSVFAADDTVFKRLYKRVYHYLIRISQ